jgi:O-antigen ligase
MKPWIVTALILLLAVPHFQWWPDYEIARRGLLALLCGLLCIFPGSIPRQIPRSVWAINLLALWFLVRSFGVGNQGYALESATHYLALATLVIIGTGTAPATILRAAVPTGLIVSLVTLAQAGGWLLPLPGVHAMTSTLGNLNTASEVLAVCGASAACLVATDDETPAPGKPLLRYLAIATLALCAAAIWINGSRSGLLALPIGCLIVLCGARKNVLIAALIGGLSLGWAIDTARTRPTQPIHSPTAATSQDPVATPATAAVRLALWSGGLKMIQERPWLGHGAGQFQIEYPRFRTREELELSTFHRRFLASPATAHNDYLQILIEGGLPAGILFLLAVAMLLRRAPISYWGPLLAFAALAGVRAPIGNAPVAALAFLFAGSLLGRYPRAGEAGFSMAPNRQIVKGLVFGGLMLWFGAAQLFSQSAGASMLALKAADRDPDGQLASVDNALLFRPYDHNFRLLRAQAALRSDSTWLEAARADITQLRQQRPHDPLVHWLWVELLRTEGKNRDAIQALEAIRVRDPYDPKAIIWTAEILVQLRQSPSAIVILYKNPQIRDRLAALLEGLADFADKRGDLTDAALLRMEQTFVTVIDLMMVNRHAAAQTQWQRFSKQLAEIDGSQQDPRSLILAAAQYLALGERDAAASLAALTRQRNPLTKTHAALMEPVIRQLHDLPAWREILR